MDAINLTTYYPNKVKFLLGETKRFEIEQSQFEIEALPIERKPITNPDPTKPESFFHRTLWKQLGTDPAFVISNLVHIGDLANKNLKFIRNDNRRYVLDVGDSYAFALTYFCKKKPNGKDVELGEPFQLNPNARVWIYNCDYKPALMNKVNILAESKKFGFMLDDKEDGYSNFLSKTKENGALKTKVVVQFVLENGPDQIYISQTHYLWLSTKVRDQRKDPSKVINQTATTTTISIDHQPIPPPSKEAVKPISTSTTSDAERQKKVEDLRSRFQAWHPPMSVSQETRKKEG